MKKLTILFIAGFLSMVMVNTADAQIEVGGGLVFGTEAPSDFGIRAVGRYLINEQFSAGADLTYFFPDKQDFPTGTGSTSEIKTSLFAINLNGFYSFLQQDELDIYALAGININIVSVEGSFGGFSASNSDSEVGLNLGAGLDYTLDFAILFGEVKYVVSNFDQLVIGAGLRFPIGN